MSHHQTLRRLTAGAGMAAGFIALAAGVAHADGDDGSPGADTDFISHSTNFFGLLTDTAAADPGDGEYVAMVLQIPSLGITDVLTSGMDPADALANTPGLAGVGDAGIGVAGTTVNTFTDAMNPALDGSFSLPFTDPLAEIWTALVPLGF